MWTDPCSIRAGSLFVLLVVLKKSQNVLYASIRLNTYSPSLSVSLFQLCGAQMLEAIGCNQGNMNHCIDLLVVIVIFPSNMSQTVSFLLVG